MALLACLLGYGEVGLWLKKQVWVKTTGNPYVKWIEDYSGEGYQAAVKLGIGAEPIIIFCLDLCLTTQLQKRLRHAQLRIHLHLQGIKIGATFGPAVQNWRSNSGIWRCRGPELHVNQMQGCACIHSTINI